MTTVRERITGALRVKLTAICDADYARWAEHLADVLLALDGIAIVELPTQCSPPDGWHTDLLGAWPSSCGEPVAAWPSEGREPRVISMPDGEFIGIDEARALAGALLAAAEAAQVRS
jgi:hypothetical protein